MEFLKITHFLDINSDNKDLPRCVTKKWIEVYNQSEGNYSVNKEIRIKTSMLRSQLCDFSDAYVVAKGTTAVIKKRFTAADFERLNNTNLNAINTNNANNNVLVKKNWFLKIMLHLLIAYQKLMV